MRSLDEFILARTHANEYVVEPGFKHLYVRYGQRYLNRVKYDDVLEIANVEVNKQSRGTFTKLVERLRAEYPELNLFVENVFVDRFQFLLLRLGFTEVPSEHATPKSYYWLALTKRD